MMKTVLGAKIIELQRYFGEMKLLKLSLQGKKLQNLKVVGCL